MKVLGVDFGERRIGLAVSDPAGRWALPLTTIERRDDRSAVREIAEIVHREEIERLVVGEPLRLDGSAGDAAERARAFAGKLERATGLSCSLVDEALTSREAEDRLRAAGVDPRKNRARVDQVAAQILLQDALDAGAADSPA